MIKDSWELQIFAMETAHLDAFGSANTSRTTHMQQAVAIPIQIILRCDLDRMMLGLTDLVSITRKHTKSKGLSELCLFPFVRSCRVAKP